MDYVTSPAQVVSADDYRLSTNILPEDVASDAVFNTLLAEAQDTITQATGHVLAACQVAFHVDLGDWQRWWVPVLPVASIQAVEVAPIGGALAAVDFADLQLVRGGDRPQVHVPSDWAGRDNDAALMRIVLNVGHSAPPPRLLRAIKMLARDWHEAQIAVEEAAQVPTPMGVMRLIRQSRYKRPVAFEAE